MSDTIEHYLNSLGTLPAEVKKNFDKMHDLDVKNKEMMTKIDSASDEYLRKVRELSPAKRKAEMEKMQVCKLLVLSEKLYEGLFQYYKIGQA